MPAKKRRLEDDDELEANPVKKQKPSKEVNSIKKQESKANSICNDCRTHSEKKKCKGCEFEYCVECGSIIFDRNAVISIDMKCPCSTCVSRERNGKICCHGSDCSTIITRSEADGCLRCGALFCNDYFHGESCPDCMEYQCSKCSDFVEVNGDRLCMINGCAMDNGYEIPYDEDDDW